MDQKMTLEQLEQMFRKRRAFLLLAIDITIACIALIISYFQNVVAMSIFLAAIPFLPALAITRWMDAKKRSLDKIVVICVVVCSFLPLALLKMGCPFMPILIVYVVPLGIIHMYSRQKEYEGHAFQISHYTYKFAWQVTCICWFHFTVVALAKEPPVYHWIFCSGLNIIIALWLTIIYLVEPKRTQMKKHQVGEGAYREAEVNYATSTSVLSRFYAHLSDHWLAR